MGDMKQTLITNYIVGGTVGHTLEDNPPPEYVRTQLNIQANAGADYVARLPTANAGELSLYEDNQGDFWLNHIYVEPQARRCGVARRLMQQAINDHGHIYASNSHIDPGGEDDTRHLSVEGAALVAGLIAEGTMQANWLRAPEI